MQAQCWLRFYFRDHYEILFVDSPTVRFIEQGIQQVLTANALKSTKKKEYNMLHKTEMKISYKNTKPDFSLYMQI